MKREDKPVILLNSSRFENVEHLDLLQNEMITVQRLSIRKTDCCRIFFVILVFLAAGTQTNAQDSRGVSKLALQQYYKGQTKTNDGENRNTIPNYNPPVNTYLAMSPPPASMPLAIPLPFRLGESERKDTLHKSRKMKAKKLTEYQKTQLWRYKLVQGTDKHLKEVFVGKCWLYQTRFKFRENVDCGGLWEAFLSGFAYKEPCDVTLEDYKDFFGMIHEDPLVNKSMLWSGTQEITHELSDFNTRFTALEDTFAGYLLDGMQWCGMIHEPGINYKQCPYECAKQKAFWGAAAKKMAERSEGIVYAVINGTRQHWKDKQIFSAYMMDSYMARNQIPNLNPDKVKEVRIMVGLSLHRKVLERCGTFSVKSLQKQIESRGIKSSCVDNPLSIRALLCLDYPKDALCQFHLTALLK